MTANATDLRGSLIAIGTSIIEVGLMEREFYRNVMQEIKDCSR
jgi:hypothetical protein